MREMGHLALVILLLAISACATRTADELYRDGKKAERESAWGRAEKSFRKLVKRYPEDERADDALLALMYIAQKRGATDALLTLAQEFMEDYPDSELRHKVQILKATVMDDVSARAMYDSLYQEATQASGDPKTSGKAEEIFEAFLDRFPQDDQADEVLFALAQVAQNQGNEQEAIQRYQKLIQTYPESPHAYKAQFMIGFIYSEELHDYAKAKEAYQRVIDQYPGCELEDDAQWMIANMGKSVDELDIFKDKK